MRAKITYLEGDFPSYIVSSKEECRDCVDRFAYDALKGQPNEKCVQVGKVCVERLRPEAKPVKKGGKNESTERGEKSEKSICLQGSSY